jgi:hypothetical protein
MKMKAIRDELLQIAAVQGERGIEEAARIGYLAIATKRRPATRRAPSCREKMTDEKREAILVFEAAHPDMPFDEIGRKFNVDGARVSEIVSGFRK